MELSWSHKLFIKVNQSLGKKVWLDKFMIFSARWLIYVLAFVVLLWGEIVLDGETFKLLIKLLMTALTSYMLIAWLLATVWPHQRPIVELAEVKQLIQPFQSWKGFPSDHTTITFTLAVVTALLGATWEFVLLLIVLASLVAGARIYVGVHYPRDIVGGMIFALIFSFLAYWLLNNITQPIYDYLVNFLG